MLSINISSMQISLLSFSSKTDKLEAQSIEKTWLLKNFENISTI